MVTMVTLMYRSNRSFNMPPSPPPPGQTPGIWHLCRHGEEGIWLSESSRGWGIWSAPTISCEISCVAGYHGGRGVGGFSWKRLCLCGQLVTRKGLKQAWFWIHECIKVVFTMTYYQRFNATIKSSTEVNITLTCRMYKVSDDSCQWNGHDVVGGIFFIERFLCCMTHEEKLSIQWPCSSDFRRFAWEVCL